MAPNSSAKPFTRLQSYWAAIKLLCVTKIFCFPNSATISILTKHKIGHVDYSTENDDDEQNSQWPLKMNNRSRKGTLSKNLKKLTRRRGKRPFHFQRVAAWWATPSLPGRDFNGKEQGNQNISVAWLFWKWSVVWTTLKIMIIVFVTS